MSRSHRIITLFLVLAAAAISAPSAFAMRQLSPGPATAPSKAVRYVYDRPDRRLIPLTAPSQTIKTPRTAPRTASPAGGFFGSDAWITVGAVLALMLLVLGSGLALSRNRAGRPRGTAAATH